jgi:hypothetical protein
MASAAGNWLTRKQATAKESKENRFIGITSKELAILQG